MLKEENTAPGFYVEPAIGSNASELLSFLYLSKSSNKWSSLKSPHTITQILILIEFYIIFNAKTMKVYFDYFERLSSFLIQNRSIITRSLL